MTEENTKQEEEATKFMSVQFLRGTAEYAYDHNCSGGTNQISESTLNGDQEVFAPTEDIKHSLQPYVNPSLGSDGDTSVASNSLNKSGLEVLGRGVKELVQAVQSLRELGVENLLPLPKIVVVGGQSAGKSSLIEGISEIKVPRDTGCCTRCPLEINLKESDGEDDPWVCEIFLSKKYIYEGAKLRSEGATRARPLGPWLPQDPEKTFFALVTSKEEVARVLGWAQMATLNPSSSHEKYQPRPGWTPPSPESQVQFSPNVVQLDISGPGLPNLHFYDLPGIINVSETPTEKYLPALVRNLVTDYIKADNCINLLAIPMTDDPANSSATALIEKAGANARTIGVLTKPDRVQKGESFEQWSSRLSGQKSQLGYGYHVVKNNFDPLVEHSVARRQEEEFFATEEPFATELAYFSDQFGTLNLQTVLSRRLTSLIQSSLPRITEQILQKAVAVDTELSSLPEPPAGNLSIVIFTTLKDFTSDLQKQIDGGSEQYPFHKAWHTLAQTFRKTIEEGQPVLVQPNQTPNKPVNRQDLPLHEASSTPTPVRITPATTFTVIDSDDEEVPCQSKVNASSGKKRGQGSMNTTPQKRAKLEDIPQHRGTREKGSAKRFTLQGIRSIIQDAYIGLSGSVDPKAIERMSKISIEHWTKPLSAFLEHTEIMCQHLVHNQATRALSTWQKSVIYEEVLNICSTFLQQAMKEQREHANRALRLELFQPITLNNEVMEQVRQKQLLYLQGLRRETRAAIHLDDLEKKSGKVASSQSRNEKISKLTEDQLGPDEWSQEIQAIATVRGYYEYASSRFVDVVCQGIKAELFPTCRNDLLAVLVKQLGIMETDAPDRCAMLLAIDPEIEQKRARLKKEKFTLEKAQEWLQGLSDTSSDGFHLTPFEM